MIDLAQQIVRDGEGAEKFVTIDVTGAASARAARRIGLAIGNSPLVKTALAAGDANWGRIVMAVGKAGEKADRDRLRSPSAACGSPRKAAPVPGYDEAPVAEHMAGRDILHRRRSRHRQGPRRRSGPATSRIATSTSMAATGADPLPSFRSSAPRWSMRAAACCWRSGPKGKAMAGSGNFPAARSPAARRRKRRFAANSRKNSASPSPKRALAAFGFASHRYDSFHILLLLYLCRRWQGARRRARGRVIAWVAPRDDGGLSDAGGRRAAGRALATAALSDSGTRRCRRATSARFRPRAAG